MKVKANGINFNCAIEGKRGAPWVVFSNSLATNLTMWDDQAAALGDRFQILRYDQRGHGGPMRPTGSTASICWSPTSSVCSTRWRSSARISSACRWAA